MPLLGRDFVAKHVRVACDAVRILCTKEHALGHVYSLDLAPPQLWWLPFSATSHGSEKTEPISVAQGWSLCDRTF